MPFALWADRTSRSGVIALALTIWSAFTALCGLAQSFTHLFLLRLGVGIGEAGGVAPSYALIADYFPEGKRARALAIYSLGIPVGLAAGTLLGAYIAHAVNWRTAFMTVGLAGILVAPVFRYFVRDLPKPRTDVGAAPPLRAVFPMLARKPTFWLLAFASSFSSLCGYGLALWTPSVMMRSFGFDIIQTGQFFGSLLLIGGVAGVFAGGWLADRLATADARWYAWLPAAAWGITAPTFALGLLAPSPWSAWPLLLVPNALNILWLGPVTTAVQKLVPPSMRATASASFLLINNLIGLGVGPMLMGKMSDLMKASYGTEALRYATVFCLGFYVLAALLALLAARRIRRDVID